MSPRREGLARPLLVWYRRARRDLPWRRTRDPYRVWVAEAMLQQTRVEAARPYYERFLAAFPTLEDLARAPIERVLVAWSGLGYYQRAHSLHRAVRECRERYGGQVPRDAEAFGALPGVGPYTRAAVLSIAYGARLAVVDGNVVRVVARRFALPGAASDAALRRRVQEIVSGEIDRRAPGDFNQAMMELGATVCTPRRPRCPDCPLAAGCLARTSGAPGRWPAPARRPAPRDVRWHAFLVERRGRILLVRCGDRGRFRGLWELPWCEQPDGAAPPRHGLELRPGPELAEVRHAVLAERIRVVVRQARLVRVPEAAEVAWVAPQDLGLYPLASVWSKALAACGLVPSRAAPGAPGKSR